MTQSIFLPQKVQNEIKLWLALVIVPTCAVLAHMIYPGFWPELIWVTLVTLLTISFSTTDRVKFHHDLQKIIYRKVLIMVIFIYAVMVHLTDKVILEKTSVLWFWILPGLILLTFVVGLAAYHTNQTAIERKKNSDIYYSLLSIFVLISISIYLYVYIYFYFGDLRVWVPIALATMLMILSFDDPTVENYFIFIFGNKRGWVILMPIIIGLISLIYAFVI